MRTTHFEQHRDPGKSDREDQPDALPVEPDEGPVPAAIPDDPEQQRMVLPQGDQRAAQEQHGASATG